MCLWHVCKRKAISEFIWRVNRRRRREKNELENVMRKIFNFLFLFASEKRVGQSVIVCWARLIRLKLEWCFESWVDGWETMSLDLKYSKKKVLRMRKRTRTYRLDWYGHLYAQICSSEYSGTWENASMCAKIQSTACTTTNSGQNLR